jgi:hypothetical protein
VIHKFTDVPRFSAKKFDAEIPLGMLSVSLWRAELSSAFSPGDDPLRVQDEDDDIGGRKEECIKASINYAQSY